MSDKVEMMKLYSQQILALAADMPRTQRLSSPTGMAKKRAPLCGSTVTVDVIVADNVIIDYAQDVKACALGQAAAAIVGKVVVGLSPAQVQIGRDQMAAMLNDGGPVPLSPFEALGVLAVSYTHLTLPTIYSV